MKIYTKKGDTGKTSLIGGARVYKSDPRIDAYGTVDELNSFIGLVRDVCGDDESRKTLYRIQNILFDLGSHLASRPGGHRMQLPTITQDESLLLEQEIDRMSESLPELRHFILPGGHPHVSYCHLARTVCRRAERRVVELANAEEVEPVIILYLNRLSDYLFVLGRHIGAKLGVDEVKWIPER